MANLILRILIVVSLLGLISWAVWLFRGIEGEALVTFAGYEIAMETSKLILLLVAFVAALWVSVAVLRRGAMWLLSFTNWFAARRHKRGLDALAKALVALAEGDGVRASREAERAETLLNNADLTRLINAQAARMAGDDARAEGYFEQMAEDSDTNYLGIMGLLRAALAEQKYERALVLAERAHTLRPKQGEVIDILFDLQKRKGDWDGARRTVLAAVKAGRFTRDVGDRRRAVLTVAAAQEREKANDLGPALEQALTALRLAPSLPAAATLAARLLNARGERRAAARRLAEAWRAAPHPELAEAFASLEPDETPAERLKRFERLFSANPSHEETRLLKAELALAADDAALARRALGDDFTARPTARAFALIAAIEQAQGGDPATVRAWLAKAAAAPRDPRWTCANCGAVTSSWAHECESCGAFDSLEWKRSSVDELSENSITLALIAPERALSSPPVAAEPTPVTPDEVTPPSLPNPPQALPPAKRASAETSAKPKGKALIEDATIDATEGAR